MLARRLTPLLALAAVAGLAASGCASQAVGVRVGDRTYSQADMLDELDAYGQNEALVPPGQEAAAGIQGEATDSYSQDFVADILQQRITFMLGEQIFDERGLELSDDDRTVAENQLATQMGSEAVDAFPDGYRERLVDDLARLNLLAQELGEDQFNDVLVDAASSTEIEINPRFGDWDESRLGIVPPDGSTPSSDAPAAEPGALPAG